MLTSQLNPFRNKLIKIPLQLLIVFNFSIGLHSCYTAKKTQATKVISETKEQLAKETQEISQVQFLRDQQLQAENIDTTISNRIVAKLSKYGNELDQVQYKANKTDTLLRRGRSFRRNYKSFVSPALSDMDSFVNKSQVRLAKYSMIKDGIAQSKKRLYEMAAFFGPGIYDIPGDKKEMADSLFIPVIDSLVNFANIYSMIDQTGTLVINGYADGMDIDPLSPLHGLLLDSLKKSEAKREDLNFELSQLRASSIGTLMENLVYKMQDKFTSWNTFNINLFEYGQGETYPTKTIKDYIVDDDRRRVVLVYWSVLPKD